MKTSDIITAAGITVLLLGLLLTGCPNNDDNTTVIPPGNNPLEGKLLILQAYGSGDAGGGAGASHSFVELYNITEDEIDLAGCSLWFANGTRPAAAGDLPAAVDGNWMHLDLNGTIPAGGSFLVLGPKVNMTARYQIPDNYGDIKSGSFILGNRSFKVVLLHGSAILTEAIQNPFDIDGNGKKAAGYIDMLGSANDMTDARPDQILGFETAPARNSASEAARRRNLIDTNNNSADFIAARYASNGFTNEELEVRKPRNSAAGTWDPFAEPEEPPPPPPGSEMLMILQANTYGNDNGGGPSGFLKSLVELYNNTNAAIDFDTDDYYLHIGNAADWTHQIKLTGSVPARCSFLITAANDAQTLTTGRAVLPAEDQEADFVLGNSGFKIALMKNRATLSVANPFGNAGLSADYVDVLGVAGTNGYETAAAAQSRPQVPRRTSLTDTDDNSADFAQADYRYGRLADDQLYKFWPRNSAAGAWDPISGDPAVHPTPNN